MITIRLALLQMDIVYGEPVLNFQHAAQLIEKACCEKPDVIVLPEMWNTGYALTEVRKIADRIGSPGASGIGKLAAKYGVNIVAGSVADLRAEKVFNTTYVYNRQGKEAGRYSKVHLFGLMKERDFFTLGDSRLCFQVDGVPCGVVICYDLRFPELSRALALDGAHVLFVPAQWPHPRLHPWRTLIQARAIENQMYVVAVNRVGKEGKTKYFGHSMVADPLGEVLLEGLEQEEILTIDIDLSSIKKVRSYMTCFSDRVPEVYN